MRKKQVNIGKNDLFHIKSKEHPLKYINVIPAHDYFTTSYDGPKAIIYTEFELSRAKEWLYKKNIEYTVSLLPNDYVKNNKYA